MAATGAAAGAQCFISIQPAPAAAASTASKGKAAALSTSSTVCPNGERQQQHQQQQQHAAHANPFDGGPAAAAAPGSAVLLRPVELVARAADMYSLEPKPATVMGGVLTVLALAAALAYTVYQVVDYSRAPPLLTSSVQWSDTQGPFPARLRCTAPGGCWVSNRHDRWSSNAQLVEPAQQGCLLLRPGQEHTVNITFTQQVRNGLTVVWDPAAWAADTTPHSGFAVLAETSNSADLQTGVAILATPVGAGGAYLANYVETHNNSAPATAARLRREWFITYVSSDAAVVPAATACADQLTPQQRAAYVMASIRMPSQWYRVAVDPPDWAATLIGNCGGALQLCLQAGAVALLAFEFLRDRRPAAWPRWWAQALATGDRRKTAASPAVHDDNGGSGGSISGAAATSSAQVAPHALQLHCLSGQVFVDEETGQHFALLSSGSSQVGGLLHQAHGAAVRGLSAMSLSGSGGVATALRGLSIGGHVERRRHQQQQQEGVLQPGVLYLSSDGGGGGSSAGVR